jgi:thiamine pyrophosphokinase
MKNKRAVIFLHGNLSDAGRIGGYIDKNTLLIGCDGGTKRLVDMGYRPAVIIGDFDSLPGGLPTGDAELARYPADKDHTDAELAVRYAVRQGCDEIIITGLLGDRLDHLIANILLLAREDFAAANLKIIEGRQAVYLINRNAVITGQAGDTISFIPLKGDARVSRSSGLKYDLSRHELSWQHNIGISNVLTGPRAEITVVKGPLLVVHRLSG